MALFLKYSFLLLWQTYLYLKKNNRLKDTDSEGNNISANKISVYAICEQKRRRSACSLLR